MYGSIFGIAKMRVTELLALALIFGIAFGRAEADLLPASPQPQGGDLTGSWTAEMTLLRAYVPAALVIAVSNMGQNPLTFTGAINGTVTFSANGTVQADYTTRSDISAYLVAPLNISVPDTSKYTGNYTLEADNQVVITRENEEPLRYTYTATADSLFIMRPLLLDELLSALENPLVRILARNTLAQYVSEDDPIKIVIGFAKTTGSGMSGGGTLAADFNGDGEVDFTDFLAFARAFGKAPGDEGYDARMDLNSSGGPIDFDDFLAFVRAFGSGG